MERKQRQAWAVLSLLLVGLCAAENFTKDDNPLDIEGLPGGDPDFDRERQEEEKLAFLSGDANGDGRLSKEEFIAHASAEGEGIEESMSPEDAAFAMKQLDEDRDGYISWEEWVEVMFHESPQVPEYRDGEEEDVSRSREEMTVAFKHWDEDGDGILTRPEVETFLRQHGESGEEGSGLTQDEINMVLWQLMDDHDKDGDDALTLEEWIEGGGY